MLLAVGPFVDQLLTRHWIGSYDFNVPALNCLFWSCAVAVLVNISQFMCLGRFSAVTFQVCVCVGGGAGGGRSRESKRTVWLKQSSKRESAARKGGEVMCLGRFGALAFQVGGADSMTQGWGLVHSYPKKTRTRTSP